MSFGDLGPGRVAAFLRTQTWPGRRWFLHHIPKTAGSSLAAEIGRRLPPYRNLAVDYSPDTLQTVGPLDAAVEAFLGSGGAWRSASGHIHARHMDRIATAHPETGFVTFLRHPVARLVSEWRYCRTENHPPFAAFMARYPTLESFVDDPHEANKMAFYLFGQRDMPPGEAVKLLQSRYVLVGLQERYPLSFGLMSRLMWGGSAPTERARVTPSTPENEIELSPDIQRHILDRNALDLALWQAVAEVYASIDREAWAILKA